MIQPTALNIVIIGLSMLIFAFLWRMSASALANRNPDSGLAQAMAVVL
jgi:hypothetical protein